MGKMMEPQLLPPPIQSCKSPENGDYKIEGETLLETDQELHETIRSHPNDDDSSTAPEEAMDNESESSVDYPFYKNKEATETAFPLVSEVSAKPDVVLKPESADMPDHSSTPQKLPPTNASDTYSTGCQPESSSKTPFRTDHLNRPPRPPGQGSTKACAKKSFVWKYFRHPEISAGVADRSRTQCILCDSQLAFNASGTTTTMLNHLKSRHGDIAEQEESLRRHNRTKGPNRGGIGGGLSVSAEHLSATDENCEQDGDTRVGGLLPNSRLTRSPVSVGQRGRPPGSGRRQKGSKQTDGMEHLNSVAMANCSLKPENNPLFAFGCYSGLIDPQQRALLNEMLMSAEALNGTKDNSLLTGITDQHGELGSFLAGGMPGAGGTPSRLDNNDPIGGLNNKSVSALLNRSSLLNAFSNTSFPLTLPVSHDLSPSSSSGLGVSVSSPLDTPTTTVSPVQPVNGRGITSPIGQTHWPNGAVHTTQMSIVQNGGNRESIQAQSSTVSTRETISTHPHVTGSVSVGRANGTINTSTSSSDIQNRLSAMNLFTPDGSLSIPSTANSAGSAAMSSAVSNPSDLGPAFDNFMNFMPSLNGSVGAGNYPLMDTLRFQQQLAANAWFASLANGKILNGSTNFGDTSALLSLFANSGSVTNPDPGKLPPGSFTANSAGESGNGLEGKSGFPFSFVQTVSQNEGLNCHQQPPPPPPPPAAPPTAATTAAAQPPQGHSLGKSALDGLMIWSQLPSTNGLGAAAAAAAANMQLPPFLNSDLLTTSLLHQHQQQQQQQQQQQEQQRLQHDRQQYMLQTPTGQQMFVPKTEVSLRNHMNTEAHMVHANFTGGQDGRIAESRNVSSLDLSKSASQAHSPENPTDDIKARGIEERVTDNLMGNTASTKRKRARPVYISPESDTKRRTMEIDYPSSADSFESAGKTPVNLTSRNQVFSTQEFQGESSGQPEIDDDDADNSDGLKTRRKKPLSRARLLHELAHYLVRDMQPPETLEGEGFKNLLSTISDQLIPSAQEMRSTILANLSKQVRKKIDDKLREFTKPNVDPTAQTGTETTSPNISFALSVELWNMKERKILDPSHSSTDRNNYLGNIQLHCSPAENRKLQSFLYRSVQVGGSALFREVLRDCQRAINSPVPDSNNTNFPNQNGWWPCTLVTNHPHTVSTMLKESEQKAAEADSPEYLVIPCLVSELARAVTTGLAVREIQSILRDCNRIVKLTSENDEKSPDERKDNSNDQKKSDFEQTILLTNTEDIQLEEHSSPVGDTVIGEGETNLDKFEEHTENHLTVSWTAAYELLKTACSTNAIKEMPEERRKCVKSLLSVIETMNQTLELIHRNDLVLTGSMIEPILENLIHTHLASNPEENKGELAVVELFKSRIADHLIQSYPTQGLVRETLQIASLLDPRFKEHVQEQKPETIKLLKTRTDCFPVQSVNGTKTSGAGNESSPSKSGEKPASDTTGLETVFGLQCFTRTSLSEVDRYLREDPIGLEEDPLAWWSEKTNAYPRVAALAAHYLTIPLTAFTPGRLRPLEATDSGQKLHNSARPRDDELGLPNVIDVLGQGRQRICTEDQAIYNYLWHNWDLTNVV